MEGNGKQSGLVHRQNPISEYNLGFCSVSTLLQSNIVLLCVVAFHWHLLNRKEQALNAKVNYCAPCRSWDNEADPASKQELRSQAGRVRQIQQRFGQHSQTPDEQQLLNHIYDCSGSILQTNQQFEGKAVSIHISEGSLHQSLNILVKLCLPEDHRQWGGQ